MVTELQWLIWSNEHRRWWRSAGSGYTESREKAGRYSLGQASDICADANAAVRDNQEPQETMLPDV